MSDQSARSDEMMLRMFEAMNKGRGTGLAVSAMLISTVALAVSAGAVAFVLHRTSEADLGRWQPSQLNQPQAAAPASTPVPGPASEQAGSGVATPTELDQASAKIREAIAAQNEDQRRPAINQLLAQPDVAAEILDTLSTAASIQIDGKNGTDQIVYAFYDPRCPYCHRAFEEFDGEFTIRWLPTLALGPGGEGLPDGDGLTSHILGEASLTKDGEGRVEKAVLAEDPKRAERLRTEILFGLENDGAREIDREMTEAQEFIVGENQALMEMLYRGSEHLIGVPSFLVQRPDGTALFLRGYDGQAGSIIQAALKGED